MNANWSGTMSGTRKKKPASGLMIPAMVAALLMAAALVGCNDGSAAPHDNINGLAAHAEAVGQDNGGLRDSLPTVSDFERLERQPTAMHEAVDHTPRADARYIASER